MFNKLRKPEDKKKGFFSAFLIFLFLGILVTEQVFFSTTEGAPVRALGASRVHRKGNAKLLIFTEKKTKPPTKNASFPDNLT